MTHSSRALENREERQVPHLNSHNKYNWRNNATDDVYCKLRIWFEGQTGIIDFAVDTETDLQFTVLFQFWYIVMMVILDVHWQWWVTKNCSIYFLQASSVLFCQWVGEQEFNWGCRCQSNWFKYLYQKKKKTNCDLCAHKKIHQSDRQKYKKRRTNFLQTWIYANATRQELFIFCTF